MLSREGMDMGGTNGSYKIGTAGAIIAAMVVAAGCSSSSGKSAAGSTAGGTSTQRTAVQASTTGASTTGASTASASTAALAGASQNSLAGRWTGTFTSTKFRATSGTFVVVFTQSGSHIGGTIKVTPSCVPDATVSGSRSGGVVSFGQVSGSGNTVAFTGAVTPNTMHGTYHSSPGCGSDSGTWQATRQ